MGSVAHVTDAATTPAPDNRRGGLTRDDIVDAALELVRTEGIQAVTMRRLADLIGVTPMALYHHVPNKAVLLDLVVERVGADLQLAHDGRPWTDQIRDYAHAWREELHRYPGVAGHLLRQAAPPAMSWRIMDDAISLMLEAGYDEHEATRAFAGLVSFVLARCDQEEIIAGHGHAAKDVEPSDDRVRSLLPTAHDNVDLGRVARYLAELSADEHFAYMLDRILAGIDAQRR